MWPWGRQFNSELLVSNFVKKFYIVRAKWLAEMTDIFSQYLCLRVLAMLWVLDVRCFNGHNKVLCYQISIRLELCN